MHDVQCIDEVALHRVEPQPLSMLPISPDLLLLDNDELNRTMHADELLVLMLAHDVELFVHLNSRHSFFLREHRRRGIPQSLTFHFQLLVVCILSLLRTVLHRLNSLIKLQINNLVLASDDTRMDHAIVLQYFLNLFLIQLFGLCEVKQVFCAHSEFHSI